MNITAALAALLGLAMTVNAAAAESDQRAYLENHCAKNLPPTKITVRLKDAPITEVNDESIRFLTKERESYHKGFFVLGLTTRPLGMEVSHTLASFSSQSLGIACIRPTIEVLIYMKYHRVSIAKELRPGTCAYQEVRAHEYRHVEVNRHTLNWVGAVIEREMKEYYGNKIWYGNYNELHQWFTKSLDQYWLPRLDQLDKAGTARHQQIDTKEEYARTSTMCNGEVPRIILTTEGLSSMVR